MLRISGKTIFILFLLVTVAGNCLSAPTSITVQAVILSKSICKFKTKGVALDFGLLDPVAATDVTRQTSIEFVCNGSADPATFLITKDDGLNASGPNGTRMQHSTTPANFIPYAVNLNPTSGTVPKSELQTLTVTGTILGNDYRNAIAGTYADTVTLTINP